MELKQLITSNFYSILYYNFEIWLMPGLSTRLKSQLLSASAKALQLCETVRNIDISFERLHDLHKRETPMKLMKYRLALQVHKIHHTVSQNNDWMDNNFQQNFNYRMRKVHLTSGAIAERSWACVHSGFMVGVLASNPAWGHFFINKKDKFVFSGVGWQTKLKSYCLLHHMVINYPWLNDDH